MSTERGHSTDRADASGCYGSIPRPMGNLAVMRPSPRWAVTVIATLIGIMAARAEAGPYFMSSSPRVASPGQVVTLRLGAGLRLRDEMPIYLVPSSAAPAPFVCGKGHALCEPTAATQPGGASYVRVGTLNVRHAKGSPAAGYGVTVRFRIPVGMAPGRYAYVLYCTWCSRKENGGSLIAWPTAGTPTMTGYALTIR
jgi:hypothetical protein